MPEYPFMVISCEHGGNRVPARYAGLFRGQRRLLYSHRGHDAGSLQLARRLARAFAAPLFYNTVTRLLIDLNRSLHHRNVFSAISRGLSVTDKTTLIRRYYLPYRNAAAQAIAAQAARNRPVLHLSVHSFTPVFDGETRDTDIGLLYNPSRKREREFCVRLQQALQAARPALRVHRNAPYRGVADGHTSALRRRFPDRLYAGIELEINQRHIGNARRRAALQRDIVDALRTVLGN